MEAPASGAVGTNQPTKGVNMYHFFVFLFSVGFALAGCVSVEDEDLPTCEEVGGTPCESEAPGDDDVTMTVSPVSPTPEKDVDHDGYSSALDCDDLDPLIHPDADEKCNSKDDDCDDLVDEHIETSYYLDADGDGFGRSTSSVEACEPPTSDYTETAGDCDDLDPLIHPDAAEECNAVDDDCDWIVDEQVSQVFYFDADRDGFGNPDIMDIFCLIPATGYVANSLDCNDSNSLIYPGAVEVCDGIDNNCDWVVDEELSKQTWYFDADADGYGDQNIFEQLCSAPEGYVADGSDCDDRNFLVHPNADEQCNEVDDDCDGNIDNDVVSRFWYPDADGDGHGVEDGVVYDCLAPDSYVPVADDCDDAKDSVYPGASEVCNGADENCDGIPDDGISTTRYFQDADQDGYGASEPVIDGCSQPDGYVLYNSDCDDSNVIVYPGALELCDEQDNDCDGSVDEGVSTTYYVDNDEDGYGDIGKQIDDCSAPTGYVSVGWDCNDNDMFIYPGATETCDGLDNDCDDVADDGLEVIYHQDADGDGYGNASQSVQVCTQPASYVLDNTDCNDTDASMHPNTEEICNTIDDNCDGFIDEGLEETLWYPDEDGDGYGNIDQSKQSCAPPISYVADHSDCDDTNVFIHPDADEQCNEVDDDCDGIVDNNVVSQAWYVDRDGDGYGVSSEMLFQCQQPVGYVLNALDCDDSDTGVHPDATETCDEVDNDCDGVADDGITVSYYLDWDEDGFGTSTSTTQSCHPIAGYEPVAGDCNDSNVSVYPGATEACNGSDDDCDGVADDGLSFFTYYRDADGDTYGSSGTTKTNCALPLGYVSRAGDCDDTNGSVYPGATETCNTIDDDCDGSVDEGTAAPNTWYQDVDRDMYGNPYVKQIACIQPGGYVAKAGDCNDLSASIHPGAYEQCGDEVDNDCDNVIDGNDPECVVFIDGTELCFDSSVFDYTQGSSYDVSSDSWTLVDANDRYATAGAYATGESPFGPDDQLQIDNYISNRYGFLCVDFVGRSSVTTIFTIVSELSATSTSQVVDKKDPSTWEYAFYDDWCEKNRDVLCVSQGSYNYEICTAWNGSRLSLCV